MCNLIHEEIISHPITGSQEDQVRSGRFFLSSLIDETISSWAPIQRIRCCGYDRKDKYILGKKKKNLPPSLGRYPTNPPT